MKDSILKLERRGKSLDNNQNQGNEVNSQPIENPVDILDGYNDDIIPKRRDNDFSTYIDDNGEQWCNIKEATKITGKSDATLRRLVKSGTIEYKMVPSPYGEMYMLKQRDVELIAEAEMMKMMKRDSSKRDLTIEIRKILEVYESTALIPIREELNGLNEAQAELQGKIEEEGKKTEDQLASITAQNEELLGKIKELTGLVEEQQTKITEQQEYIDAQKSKGFWGRLFGK